VAQKLQVTVIDDIDGSDAAETVKFGLDGRYYEIDLTAGHAGELRGELEPFTRAARKLPASAYRKKRASRDDLPDIRAWARARGHKVSERGKIPARIVAEYDAMMGLA
jgi:hypothetical protein